MMDGGTWAVVPVKPLRQAKQRLAPVLSDAERSAFALAMLEDVLAAIATARTVQGLLVVSDDPDARRLAQHHGGRLLPEPTPGGLSAAVTAAAKTLAADGADTMLFLPGDVPLLTGNEIARLMTCRSSTPSVTVVPSRDGLGTNAILCQPPGSMSFHFGSDSFQRHLGAARRIGVTPHACSLDGLSRDIDEPSDLIDFARRAFTTRSHAYLARQGIAARLIQGRHAMPKPLATASH